MAHAVAYTETLLSAWVYSVFWSVLFFCLFGWIYHFLKLYCSALSKYRCFSSTYISVLVSFYLDTLKSIGFQEAATLLSVVYSYTGNKHTTLRAMKMIQHVNISHEFWVRYKIHFPIKISLYEKRVFSCEITKERLLASGFGNDWAISWESFVKLA